MNTISRMQCPRRVRAAFVLPSIAAAMLAGCSTPQPILGLAAQGAVVTQQAGTALDDYLAVTRGQLSARMDLIRQEARRDVGDDMNLAFDRYLLVEAGMKSGDEVAQKIRAIAQERQRLREQAEATTKGLDQSLALDTAALPAVPTEQLAAARKSFLVLAQELSPKDWVKLVVDFAREIRDGVGKLRNPDATPGQ